MPAYAAVHPHDDEDDERHHPRASIAFVLAASILSGAGLLLVLLWLINGAWVDFVGIPIMGAGFLLFFSPRAGPDRGH